MRRVERIERVMLAMLSDGYTCRVGTTFHEANGTKYANNAIERAYEHAAFLVDYVDQRAQTEYQASQQARDVAAMLEARDSAPLPLLRPSSTPASWDGEPGPVLAPLSHIFAPVPIFALDATHIRSYY